MINNWNSVVSPEDKVYHLGDFSLSHSKAKEILPLLNGYKILICGNHDKNPKDMIAAGFDEAYYEIKIKIGNKTLLVKHRPTPNSGFDSGRWLLHGHTHNNKDTAKINYDNKWLNLSCEWWDYTPVKESEIMKIINSTATGVIR